MQLVAKTCSVFLIRAILTTILAESKDHMVSTIISFSQCWRLEVQDLSASLDLGVWLSGRALAWRVLGSGFHSSHQSKSDERPQHGLIFLIVSL